MITSRPKTSNLISFILFLVIACILVAVNILSVYHDPQPPWFNYLIPAVLAPIALFITWKTIFRYKIITMGNGQVCIGYPQFRIKRTYSVRDISEWKETIIKTGKNSVYKELEVRFSDSRSITMAFKEFSDYEKMVGYLKLKAPRSKAA